MNIITNIWDCEPRTPSVVTIGTFDGVHLGHQKIIQRVVNSSKEQAGVPSVFTFFPHPRMILQPHTAPKQIQTIDEKIALLQSLGIEQVIIQPFDQNFANLSAEDFVKNILIQKLQVCKIIVGYDHHFGKNRTANIQDLRLFGKKYHFEVEEISAKDIDEVTISSTKIRKALETGEIKTANLYLGHPFSISGKVIHGQEIGRTISFPTANIEPHEQYKLIPKKGVYAVYSFINNKKIFGMMNIGENPTFEGKTPSIEVHFFDFQANLYGQNIQIYLTDYIREERKFASAEQLKEQLKKDEITIRNILKS